MLDTSARRFLSGAGVSGGLTYYVMHSSKESLVEIIEKIVLKHLLEE